MSNETVLDPPAELHEVNPVSEAARKLNALSHEAKRRNLAERQTQRQEPSNEPSDSATPDLTPTDEYVSRMLLRVRGQLDALHDKLEKAETAQDIERLGRAIAALSETERKLAGRPDPGSRRPGKERERTAAREVHPI